MFFSARPRWWHALRKTGLVVTLAGAVLVAGPIRAKQPAPDSVSVAQLPREAQATHRLILAGGPFPNFKDGSVFGNRERVLPREPRGYYHEYTVPTPGARDRGARRIVCGGARPARPEACFYSGDHYATFSRIVQ